MSRRSSGQTPKWTIKQDEKLRQAVQKHGKQWTLISQKYKFQRSINSLVKRWHGKLKDEPVNKKNQQLNKQLSQQQSFSQKNLKKKRIKKQRKKQQQVQENSQSESSVIQNSQSIIQQEQSEQQDNEQDDTLSNQIQSYVFEYEWKQQQDKLLKDLIVNQKVLNWQQLSKKVKISNLRQIRRRWQKNIYPTIIQTKKIGGCVKYSDQQDSILSRGVKIGLGIQQLRKFLPSRTLYSLDARRRRTLKADEQQQTQLRYWKKKMLAFKFVQKRHQHLQKPIAEQQFLLYRAEQIDN